MSKNDFSQQSNDYMRIEKAIGYVSANFKSRPTLDQIAESAHLSRYHFDRLFKRWAGISPIQFLQFLTVEHAKQKLAESRSLLDTSLEAGLTGPGRLHDLFVRFEAMSPGEFKQMGAGMKMEYGFHPTPFGGCLMVVTGRGISHLSFIADDDRAVALTRVQQNWPKSTLSENRAETGFLVNRIFSFDHAHESRPFHLLLKGTNFQVNVWRALLSIPAGHVVSYEDIAAYIGRPMAFRAVANAVAANPVAYLIPCHRVIKKTGQIHQYRWGADRKKAILGWEAAKISTSRDADG
jgi:AraC family transcriptional regulator, regulatory protein of adaptative response / methylated-DNA-[protein]-cysteine methyltransferase